MNEFAIVWCAYCFLGLILGASCARALGISLLDFVLWHEGIYMVVGLLGGVIVLVLDYVGW